MADPMAALLGEVGIQPVSFRAKSLNANQIRSADLVLAMTRAHRGDVVELWPRAVKYTFTLKEFGRLVRGVNVPPGQVPDAASLLRELVPLARAERRHVSDARLDEVIDPYRRSEAVYAEAFRDIVNAVDDIVVAVQGGRDSDLPGAT